MIHPGRFSRRRFVASSIAFATTLELQRAAWALGFSSAAEVCKLVPEQEVGPFYVADELLRRNITEDKVGVPLAIKLMVLDSRSCKPLTNAAIDLWHCDAMGLYSGYTSSNPGGGPGEFGGLGGPPRDRDSSGGPPGPPPDGFGPPPGGAPKPTDKFTFLRGIQITDNEGAARFDTVFPGFYMGRTNHIHFKVRVAGHEGESSSRHTYLAGHTAHTGQLFFPEELAVELMKHEPYSTHKIHRTAQGEDMVYNGQYGSEVISKVVFAREGHAEAGLTASLIVAVDPTATPEPVGVGGRGGFRPPRS